ncbi:hypothetical protein [Alteromonas macleodii]|jgi:hypothetical protein|uniref:hypothetical protein n=1 Tax=Alteromonas macleodii TaxID=28108 RepID=UPI00127C4B39|nr:hypothetical protein [Alteromonas macleodii]CAI2390581.1 hypothetical protein ALT831_02553 [Alteromonas macleodii]CAI3962379.1 hypothetical protein ALTBGP9_02483 [Alteromonas macleodii]CAI3962705.1 hypothetical protein ALTBGP14_02553 [Alteromonas macleodii]CAI3962713.1 hypothetical protein ALTBGP6_02553 [Alteromonas macleodii]VTO40177.1 hypothetical protein ALTBGP6_02553 [Alteromonas macleodii]|tara:strand:+ start:234 stop:983 length:750 start_codon:yes stop_codon:yes gene_type:complete|mmetsp:Transcript_53697/g.109884  ORF Transcript_53697/g.109884 Transcript_53697/m.109884 type:complete len:250 (+) Transcript_53697:166-915(+)
MSNKNIPNREAMPVVQRESTTLNGTTPSSLKSSPLFGWLFAGSDLLSSKLDQAAGVVSQKIDNTQETINAMQAKGLEVESELRRTLNPFALVDTAQKLVASTPLFSALSGGQKRQQKEQQLEMLSAKVDLLVEQVALLAAKEVAKKAEVTSTASKATANNRTATKSSSAKPTTTGTRKSSKAKTTTTTAASSPSATKKAATGTANKRTVAKSTAAKSTARKTTASTKASPAKSTTKSTSASSDITKNDE